MDQVKIGQFLAQLRHEAHFTQEELGEKLGVTNKTISRWENGVYTPDIEMLQSLSKEYHVSINELISGERIEEQQDYQAKAEQNLIEMLKESRFSLAEKVHFYKKKWLKDHIAFCILAGVILIIALIVAIIMKQALILYGAVVAGLVGYCMIRNRMMIYVEQRAYGSKTN